MRLKRNPPRRNPFADAYRNGVPPKPKVTAASDAAKAAQQGMQWPMQQSLWRRDASHQCGSRADQQTPPLLLLDCAVPASAQEVLSHHSG